MSQSLIIVDPKTELIGKQDINSLLVQPIVEGQSAKDIGIDQVRLAIKWSHQTSFSGQPRFIIITQASKLTHQAQQALLKTLEEPADDLTVIIAPQQLADLLPTIQSRCAVYQIDQLPSSAWQDWPINRQSPIGNRQTAITMDWDQFIQASTYQQLDFLTQYLKAKKSPQALLQHWITQTTHQLRQAHPSPQLLHQLNLLHQAQQSLNQHVSARLVFNTLHIELDSRF